MSQAMQGSVAGVFFGLISVAMMLPTGFPTNGPRCSAHS
jgi:hypothetical protein